MNPTKLGLRITSSVLATALALAPLDVALAAPAEGEDAEGEDAEGEDPAAEGEEGEPAEGEDATAEGEEGEPAEGEEGEPAAGEEGEPAAGEEGEPAEGEEGETEVDAGEGEEAEGEDAEGEGEEAEGEEDEELEIAPAPGPMRPDEPMWGNKNPRPMNGKGMLITGGVVTGLGAAFIVTSVLITSCNFDSSLSCKFGDQRDFLVPTAVAATGLGLLLIGVGVGNHVKYKRWQNWTPEQTAVVPTMVPGGGGVAWVGRF